MSHQHVDVSGEGKETVEQRGGIPGLSELDTAIRQVVGEEGIEEDEVDVESTGTSLPFTIGGGATEEISNLPFGVGSKSAGLNLEPATVSDSIQESKPEIETIIETEADSGQGLESEQSAEIVDHGDDEHIPQSDDWPETDGWPEPEAEPEESIGEEPEPKAESTDESGSDDGEEMQPLSKNEPVPEEGLELQSKSEIDTSSVANTEREQVPLPGFEGGAADELETVPLPDVSTESVSKPIKVKAVIISDEDEVLSEDSQHEPIPDSTEGESEDEVNITSAATIEGSTTLAEGQEGHYRIEAVTVDMEQLYAEPEQVVELTFEDDELVTEVAVNLDEMPDDEPTESVIFAPEHIQSEPELFPAQALDIDTHGDGDMSMLLDSGFGALSEGRWDQAARSFRSMAAKQPGDASILNNYGLALLQHATGLADDGDSDFTVVDSQYEAAIMALRQAAKSNPEEPLILYNLGTALVSSGRHDKAVRILDVVLERDNSPTLASLNARAAAYAGMGNFEDARRDLEAALKEEAGNEIVTANIAMMTPT